MATTNIKINPDFVRRNGLQRSCPARRRSHLPPRVSRQEGEQHPRWRHRERLITLKVWATRRPRGLPALPIRVTPIVPSKREDRCKTVLVLERKLHTATTSIKPLDSKMLTSFRTGLNAFPVSTARRRGWQQPFTPNGGFGNLHNAALRYCVAGPDEPTLQ